MTNTTAVNITSRTLSKIIEESNGKFVSVDFYKKDGTLRTLTGRLGVQKYLKGGVRTTDPEKYICIYDTVNEGYRSINRDTIVSVRCSGIKAEAVN